MTLAMVVVIGFGIPLLIYSFLMFDRVVKTEYESNREAWELDGKPYGYLWKAPECTYFRSSWARNRLSFAWLFTTPKWTLGMPNCQSWLTRMRICVLGWNIMIVSLFLALASS